MKTRAFDVVGRVFDTSIGVDAGIHFALVELHIPGASGGVTSATTDTDGSFAITLPPGDETYVFVSVSAQGYYPFHQWSSGAKLRQASPLAIRLQPAPQQIDTTVGGIVYDAGGGPTAPIADAEVRYTYHSYQEAFPEVSDTLRTGIDGRYSFEQPLGPGDWIEFTVVAAGFADFQVTLGSSDLIDGPPRDFGLARLGGMIRIDPVELRIDCPATFPVTITNVDTADETLVILGIDLRFDYGEGVYGTAFVADLSQVHFPVLLARGEQLRFPTTFIGGGTFPSLLSLNIISGARNVGGVAYFAACGDDAAPAPTSPSGGEVRTLLRTCETAARGSAPEFRQLSTASPAAAIVFVGLRCADCRAGPVLPEERDPRYYEPFGDGRFRLNKVFVGVATGSTVTVVVPEAERGRVALLYDTPLSLSADGLYRMAEGESQVTFEACDDPETGFPGEFLVAGPRCVELEVHLGDAVDRVLLPFGVDDCAE